MNTVRPLRCTELAIIAMGVLNGCAPSDTQSPCRAGTTLADDGHCYADNAPTVFDALQALPECRYRWTATSTLRQVALVRAVLA